VGEGRAGQHRDAAPGAASRRHRPSAAQCPPRSPWNTAPDRAEHRADRPAPGPDAAPVTTASSIGSSPDRQGSPWPGSRGQGGAGQEQAVGVRALISATSSASRAHSSTGVPSLASACASAVPQAPAPITPIGCRSCLHPRAAHRRGIGIERPARPRHEIERIALPQPLDPRPGDHRRIVGAQRQRRRDERQAVFAAKASSAPRTACWPQPARDDQRAEAGRAGPAPCGCGRSRNQSPPAGTRRRYRHRHRARLSLARSTALFRPANEKCGSALPSSGRGRGPAFASPVAASRSTAGPPG
jgi:hypothetical protein